MRSMRARRLFALLTVVTALAGAVLITRPYVHGLSFVIRAAEMQGAPRRAADWDTTPVRTGTLVGDRRGGEGGRPPPRRRLGHHTGHHARDRDPDTARPDARAPVRTIWRSHPRRAADVRPARVGHRRAAPGPPRP